MMSEDDNVIDVTKIVSENNENVLVTLDKEISEAISGINNDISDIDSDISEALKSKITE